MLTNSYLIPALFLTTFAIAIALGIYQYYKAKKARANHQQSVQAKVRGERPGERHDLGATSDAINPQEDNTPRPRART